MMTETMDDFLQESAASGEKLTAEESFTLAPEKVWARLQQILPKKEFWILKLVQAAVGWGAKSLDFEATDEELSAQFALPNPPPEPQGFWQSDVLEGPLHHLRVAVATVCGAQSEGEVRLDWATSTKSVSLVWKGEEHEPEEQVVKDCKPSTLRLTVLPAEGSWLGKLFQGDLFHAEWYALKDRLLRESIDIRVNQEPLGVLEPGEAMFRPVLAEAHPFEDDITRVSYRFHRSLVLPRYLDFMKSTETKQRRGDYGSRLMPITATTVHWILHGIVVDRWRRDSVETAVAADIQLCAEGLELDLSGFSVKESDQAQERVAQTLDLQRSLLEQAKAGLPQKLEHAAHREKVNKSVYGMDLAVGICFPPYLLLGLIEVFRLPKATTKLLEGDLTLCLEHIERRAASLEGVLLA